MDEVIRFEPSDFQYAGKHFAKVDKVDNWTVSSEKGDNFKVTQYILSRLCESDVTQVNIILDHAKTNNHGNVIRQWEAQLCVKNKVCAEYTPTFARREHFVAAAAYLFLGSARREPCNTCNNLLSAGPCVSCVVIKAPPFKGSCANCFYHNKGAICSIRKDDERAAARKAKLVAGNLPMITQYHLDNMTVREMEVTLRRVEMHLQHRQVEMYAATTPSSHARNSSADFDRDE